MIRRVLVVARKELLHIRRDRRTLAVVFMIPMIQLLLMGYAATTDIDHLRTAALDADLTSHSRGLIEAYQASNYFDIVAYVSSEEELAHLLDRGTVRAGLIIPPGYGSKIAAGEQAEIAFIIDGSDPNVANVVFAAAQQVGQAQGMRLIEQRLSISPEEMTPIEVHPRVWYNPEMNSANFMIPGLIAMILFTITILLTSMAIVREREWGTIEQLMVTPIRPFELVVGKVAPYILLAFFDVLEILALGVFWFHVPVNGSVSLLLALAGLFLVTSLGLGIFFSSVANTQQEAMLMVFMMLLPSIFLAGFFFPLEAMPYTLQLLSYLVPLRYMLVIVRGIIIKGVGIEALAEQVVALAVSGVAIMAVAATQFRKRLE